ncbi:hypothetical protein M2277_005106 [Paenibacillus sp. LBL]|uniref:hypothetical protein n=1 Tax=Paenibacillus sp. LBL TaxID=2940563 RepID=UPI002474C1D6|nr:hypothetical protein [Paenibacillus sp. LBL]MDH6674414.1 hypothetical protein [Paenibacillus sp. LBL]
MGSVQIDIYKSEREFSDLNLSDQNIIKYLITYRDKVDIYYGAEKDVHYNNAGNVKRLNQELVHLYAALDELIELCKFNGSQRQLIHLVSIGYTFKDIEEVHGELKAQSIERKFNTICKKIAEMNMDVWKVWVHKNRLGTSTKVCSCCGRELPQLWSFFGTDARNADGFKAICKKCDSYTKKQLKT